MEKKARLEFFASILGTFLGGAREHGHVCFTVLGDQDCFVQFALRGDGVLGEVGSRQWAGTERPLSGESVAALAQLGFAGGGPEKNYTRAGLPADVVVLSELAEKTMRAAYRLDDDYAVVVYELNLNDVSYPVSEAFTRGMIERHLRSHGAEFLRDQDGDYRLDLMQADGSVVVIWLIACGPWDCVYRVTGTWTGAEACDRGDALERCNAWNSAHRGVSAWVLDAGESWRCVVGAQWDLKPGISEALFDKLTLSTVDEIVGFFASAKMAEAPRDAA